MATLEQVTQLMANMSLAFPRYELQKGAVKIYHEMLKDIPGEILDAAAKEVIINSAFFPAISEWRSKAINLMIASHKIPTAAQAWEEAISHCRRGEYSGYSHPLIEKAAMTFTIPFWQSMLEEHEMATRAHFFKVYEQLLNREMELIKMLPESKAVSAKYQLEIEKLAKRLSGPKDNEAKE